MSNIPIYCIHAYKSLRFDQAGGVAMCCIQHGRLTDEGIHLSAHTDSVNKIMNSDSAVKIRKQLENGEWPTSCNVCEFQERVSGSSKRLIDNMSHSNSADTNVNLRIIDISAGNTCNLKCRICSPRASSQWVQEHIDEQEERFGKIISIKTYDQIVHGYSNSLVWSEIEANAENIIEIDMYGGEPFLVKNNWSMLQHFIEKDIAKNVIVHLNTNGTIWNESKVKILEQFKEALVSFSIDGVDKQFEYLRFPGKFPQVDANIRKALKTKCKINICYSVCAYNIFYVSEFLDYVDDLGTTVYINHVYESSQNSLRAIPIEVKEILLAKLIAKNDIRLASTISILEEGEQDLLLFDEFKTDAKWHDSYRNEKFEEAFPEYYELITPTKWSL